MTTGRTVLVAGGAGALGSAVVRRLASDGWDVVATTRPGGEAAGALPARVHEVDVTDEDAVRRLVAQLPQLHAVVNTVGGYAAAGKVHEDRLDRFEEMFTVNVRPAVLLAAAAIPRLVSGGGGSFVAVGSRASVQPFAGAAAYITAKGALLAFMSALDADYRRQGVRCNTVLPSVIDTPANRAAQPDADYGRWVSPEQVAGVIAFLVSDASAPTSGAAVPAYGTA